MSIQTTQQLLQNLAEHLTSTSSVQKVYGDPIVTPDKTIIPVASVSVGFGGGYGEGHSTKASTNPTEGGQGEGGGVGGGLMIKPLGVYEVTATGTRYIPLAKRRYIAIGLALGFVLSRLIRRR
ncbi:spore germination protein GerW family protein [Spirosoma sp. SC4-14]|uniref:GerW family sporulation protein n=1 Tax=Spirosoma sp. SC4-14 TaxID=3128900 RepID=UPI0030CD7DCC